jgi:hypothetical protein
VVDPLEEITPKAEASELATRLLRYFESYKMAALPMVEAQLEKALEQEYRRGVEEAREAIGAALRYRPISPEETR